MSVVDFLKEALSTSTSHLQEPVLHQGLLWDRGVVEMLCMKFYEVFAVVKAS